MMRPSGPAAITASACASSTSAISTRAPSSAKPSVSARPMFDAPPVMTTLLPSRFRSIAHTSGAICSVSTLQALESPAAEQREDQVVDAGLHQRPRVRATHSSTVPEIASVRTSSSLTVPWCFARVERCSP